MKTILIIILTIISIYFFFIILYFIKLIVFYFIDKKFERDRIKFISEVYIAEDENNNMKFYLEKLKHSMEISDLYLEGKYLQALYKLFLKK